MAHPVGTAHDVADAARRYLDALDRYRDPDLGSVRKALKQRDVEQMRAGLLRTAETELRQVLADHDGGR